MEDQIELPFHGDLSGIVECVVHRRHQLFFSRGEDTKATEVLSLTSSLRTELLLKTWPPTFLKNIHKIQV